MLRKIFYLSAVPTEKKKEKKGKRKRREKKERKKGDVFDAGLSRQDVEGMWIA